MWLNGNPNDIPLHIVTKQAHIAYVQRGSAITYLMGRIKMKRQ